MSCVASTQRIETSNDVREHIRHPDWLELRECRPHDVRQMSKATHTLDSFDIDDAKNLPKVVISGHVVRKSHDSLE